MSSWNPPTAHGSLSSSPRKRDPLFLSCCSLPWPRSLLSSTNPLYNLALYPSEPPSLPAPPSARQSCCYFKGHRCAAMTTTMTASFLLRRGRHRGCNSRVAPTHLAAAVAVRCAAGDVMEAGTGRRCCDGATPRGVGAAVKHCQLPSVL